MKMKLSGLFISGLLLAGCASLSMTPAEQHEALTVHNELRRHHGAPVLEWSNTLARYAARHASRCLFQHSHGAYGENLAAGYPSISAAIQAWYAENKSYSYQQAHYVHGTGHFTQLVWKSSTQIGCALNPCHDKNGTPGNFLVCEYSPAGNVINPGYFKQNVAPPVSH